MNGLLPRQSAESVCLFCRQGLLRQWRQQQRQHVFEHAAGTAAPSASAARLLALPQQRRRFLSGSAAASPAAAFARTAEQTPAEQPAATAPASSSTPYKRYSLYTDSTAPMTIRPPPPPPAAAQASTSATSATTAAAATSQAPAPATEPKPSEASAASAASAAAAATATATAAPAPKKRPSKLRAPRKAAMRLTPAAVEQVRELLEGPEPKLIKVGVRNRGCSGLAYNLEYVDKPGAFDELVEQDGVRVLVDSKALFSIIGSEMDWVEDKLNQRFVFRNPNIKEECGCGESFMV